MNKQPVFRITKLDEAGERFKFEIRWIGSQGITPTWEFERMTLVRLRQRINIALGPENLKHFLREAER